MDDRERYMLRALELAERAWGRTSPNPMVGAVIVLDGEVVGEGWHEGPGTAHAEVMALAQAGERARGATVFCSLEPCNHTGRTGPCTKALIQAGVTRVVVAVADPNPLVEGRGLTVLRAAGIDVESGILETEARRLNEAFERQVVTGLPFVVLKMASSLDGKTAARDGTSKWITGEAARADVQRLRAWSDAIVIGAGSAIADDPSLTVRDPRFANARPPLRVIVDSAGRVPPTGRIFDESAPTVVATTAQTPDEKLDAWTAAGAEALVLESDENGGVSLAHLLHALGKRDAQGVLVEGGASLAWSFVRDRLIDKIVLYLAPTLLGGDPAPGLLMGGAVPTLSEALPLTLTAVDRIDQDLRVEAHVHWDR